MKNKQKNNIKAGTILATMDSDTIYDDFGGHVSPEEYKTYNCFGNGEPGSDEKFDILIKAYSLGYPIRAWGYAGMSLKAIETIFNDAYDKKVGPQRILDIDMWKIVNSHIPDDIDKLKAVILALSYGVHMMDEIDYITTYSAEVLTFVAQKAVTGKNICKYIHKGVTLSELGNL